MFKNVASKMAFFAFDVTTGEPVTGDAANLTAYVSKDYGSVTVLADTSAAEMSSANAAGWYLFDTAQAESNADALLFTCKSSTADVVVVGPGLIFTTPPLVALFTGMTSLAQWLGLLAGKQVGDSTARTELRATGAGSGTFDETVESLEALKDDQMTATDLEDAVWDASMASHLDSGSTGAALNGAGAAGDPWGTTLPGAYGAGTAGKIVGDNLNATVSSRATPAQVATELGTYDGPTNAEMVARTLAAADYATAAAQTTAQTDLDTLTGSDGVVIASGTQTFNMTGNVTGNLSGSVGSVSGAVGSVTGAVGSVTGAVGSVTGNVGGNVVGSIGSLGATAASNVRTQAGNALADYGAIP